MSIHRQYAVTPPVVRATLGLGLAILTVLVSGGCPTGGSTTNPDLVNCVNRLDLFNQAASGAIATLQNCGAGEPCPDACVQIQDMNALFQQLQDAGCFTGNAGQPELGAQLQAEVQQLTQAAAGVCS